MKAGMTLSDGQRSLVGAGVSVASRAPILVVDDSRVSQRLAGRLVESGTGREVVYASNGNQALAFMAEVEPSVVLTDLQMPGMDGFELVGAIRAAHPRVPVILMTAYGSEEAAMRALTAGAAYYVPKKNLVTDLVEAIRRILTLVTDDRSRRQVLSLQASLSRSFDIANDADLLAPMIELIREDLESFAIGDETARIRVSVALQESLANALYHGNLECSTELRQEDERDFYELAARRREIEPFRSRRIRVDTKVDREGARIVIRDQGPGFDVASLEKPLEPEDLMRVGGRGIILIRTFMDEVSHNASGNEISLFKRK